jgi:putative zinc ribbon protein
MGVDRKKKSKVRLFERDIRIKELLHAGIIDDAAEIPRDAVPVSLDIARFWRLSYSLQRPPYYQDIRFTCADCDTDSVWTAQEQRHWFEILHGSPYSTAKRCAACRKKRKTKA